MSDRIPTDQPTTTGSDFSSTFCGQGSGSAQGSVPLQPEGGWLAINGSTDLSSCIVGNSGAYVSQIFVSNQPPFSIGGQYCVWVYGQGPAGYGSGALNLEFTDQTQATHGLSLFSSSLEWHYIEYNTENPGIVAMSWAPSTT